mgnify:FL=1|jgi:hypothetical protein|tara:strand:+ start:385 stop:1308 length:924 start_codon:yes stop_codon:yes gene_type:complete
MADITASRINNLQSSIALVLGTGSGQTGYGQTVTSVPVNNTGDIVEAADMNAIYADILKARVHQVGAGDIGISQVIQNLNIVAENTSNFISDSGVVTTDPDGFKKGIEDFENLMSTVIADKAIIDATQADLEPGITSVRSSTWNGLIYHEIQVTFSSADAKRFFFNAGGEIRLSANNTSASTPKGLDWNQLCSQVGTIKFGAENTVSTSGGGSSIGNYDLTGAFQNIYQKIGSGTYSAIYAGNIYTVKARSDIDTRIIFRIEFNDIVFDNNVDNNVDGRLESVIQHYRANGEVVTLAPSYFNSNELA